MILPEHEPHHKRLALYQYDRPMLMLGNQEDKANLANNLFREYTTFDPDGGDITEDIQSDLERYYGRYNVVYNLGTLEHVWDAHRAYSNVAKMIKLGGIYAGHSPVGGYENHGIHVTDYRQILSFFQLNGFDMIDHWLTDQQGNHLSSVRRLQYNTILWCKFIKVKEIDTFVRPQQVFMNGAPI